MAFIDHNVTEVIFRIEGSQKSSITIFSIYAQSLVRCNMNSGIFSIVGAVRFAICLCRIGTKDVLKSLEGLCAKLVAVTHKQRAGKLPGIRHPFQQVHCNESLARSCGKRKQRPLWFLRCFTTGNLFHDGAYRRVLIVAARPLSSRIGLEQGFGCR